MDAERWRRVDQLLQSALLVPPARRDEFLCRECAGDAALEGEVRSLLDSHHNADSFLERPAIRVAARAPSAQMEAEECLPFILMFMMLSPPAPLWDARTASWPDRLDLQNPLPFKFKSPSGAAF